MIVISIPSWRKKLIILACIILLAAAFSIGLNYYKNMNAGVEFEEMFEDAIGSETEMIEEATEGATPGEQTDAVDNDNGEEACEDEENKDENPDDADFEEEFEEKELKKGFWEKILEKFRKE